MTGRRGRRRNQLLDYPNERKGTWNGKSKHKSSVVNSLW